MYEKVMNGGSEAGSGAGTPTGDSRGGHGPEGEEGSSMAEGQVGNLFSPWIFYFFFVSAISGFFMSSSGGTPL